MVMKPLVEAASMTARSAASRAAVGDPKSGAMSIRGMIISGILVRLILHPSRLPVKGTEPPSLRATHRGVDIRR
jgi:hypothetical protein